MQYPPRGVEARVSLRRGRGPGLGVPRAACARAWSAVRSADKSDARRADERCGRLDAKRARGPGPLRLRQGLRLYGILRTRGRERRLVRAGAERSCFQTSATMAATAHTRGRRAAKRVAVSRTGPTRAPARSSCIPPARESSPAMQRARLRRQPRLGLDAVEHGGKIEKRASKSSSPPPSPSPSPTPTPAPYTSFTSVPMMRSKRARIAASTSAMYPNASATSRHASVSRADPSAV